MDNNKKRKRFCFRFSAVGECFVGMQEDWRQYRQIVKGMEANAKLIMSTESILSKYIEEPFEVRGCEEHVQ